MKFWKNVLLLTARDLQSHLKHNKREQVNYFMKKWLWSWTAEYINRLHNSHES